MEKPVLLHDTKRAYVYQYGKDGKITISKRLEAADEIDLALEIESGNIEVANASDCKQTLDIFGTEIDMDAFTAIDMILDELF